MNDTLIAAIVLEAQSITKDMKKAFEMRSDSLEARIRVLEDQSLRNQLQVVGPDKPFKVVLPADKRPRGRPKKVA